jgi:hypothetical protein
MFASLFPVQVKSFRRDDHLSIAVLANVIESLALYKK